MSRTRTVTAEHTFEVEIGLSGTFCPGAPEQGPSYASGGQPADPDEIADLEIVSIGALCREWGTASGLSWKTIDLLAGVDRQSDAYKQICANIVAFIGNDAEEALFNEAVEF